jgi:hypothetical protein
MTQQELLCKLNLLLKPSGYQFRLLGSWASGKIHVPKDHFTFSAKIFTFQDLWEIMGDYTSEKNIKTVGKEKLAEFFFIVMDALRTFSDDERETVIRYEFDYPMFEYLQEMLPSLGINISKDATPVIDKGSVYLSAYIGGREKTFYTIAKRRFDFHGLGQEIKLIPEDLIALEEPYIEETVHYIKLFEKCLKAYKRKLIEEEVLNVLAEN